MVLYEVQSAERSLKGTQRGEKGWPGNTENVQIFDFISFSFVFTTALSHWDFSHRKFGLLSPGKTSCNRVVLPNLRCMLGGLVFP